ncbi:uncharacterized protein LOC110445111 [Mizuhopecten yessoensis]|uniref:uncharacterized protein LOC110445111 n=1 Tax=Mizuhopecten yessoensis TaxID=6573 RepID=UPI000B45A239|nr:uncharacterized protein LOC110445111 [Mizuhopecten yessoensis]
MVTVIPFLSKLPQVWIILVLTDVVLLGFGRAIQDDGRFLCFPSPNSDKYCICFDIGDSSFTYVPRNEFPAQLAFKVQDGHFEDNLPADDHAINLRMDLSPHERTTGIDVKAVKSLLLDLMRQVSTYKKQSKRSHVLAKRPFDSISYGSYFGGFGKK